jgi:hypothetical protein
VWKGFERVLIGVNEISFEVVVDWKLRKSLEVLENYEF